MKIHPNDLSMVTTIDYFLIHLSILSFTHHLLVIVYFSKTHTLIYSFHLYDDIRQAVSRVSEFYQMTKNMRCPFLVFVCSFFYT